MADNEIAGPSDSVEDEDILPGADADVWALLPRKFRADVGAEGRQLSDVGLLWLRFFGNHQASWIILIKRERREPSVAIPLSKCMSA